VVSSIAGITEQQLLVITSLMAYHARLTIAAMPIVGLGFADEDRVVEVDAGRMVPGSALGASQQQVLG